MRKQSMADIYTNLQDKETWLLEKANVVGCGIGEKIKAGLPLGRICLKVYVEIKLPLNKLAKHDIIPQAVSLIETDVEEIGKISEAHTTMAARRFIRRQLTRIHPINDRCYVGHFRLSGKG